MIDRVNLVFGDDGMMPLAITFAPYLTLTLTDLTAPFYLIWSSYPPSAARLLA